MRGLFLFVLWVQATTLNAQAGWDRRVWEAPTCRAFTEAKPTATSWLDGLLTGLNLHAGEGVPFVSRNKFLQSVGTWCQQAVPSHSLVVPSMEAFLETRDSEPLFAREAAVSQAQTRLHSALAEKNLVLPAFDSEKTIFDGLNCRDQKRDSTAVSKEAASWWFGLVTGVTASSPLKVDIFSQSGFEPNTLLGALQTGCAKTENSELHKIAFAVYADILENYEAKNDANRVFLTKALEEREKKLIRRREELLNAQTTPLPTDLSGSPTPALLQSVQHLDGRIREVAKAELVRRYKNLKARIDRGEKDDSISRLESEARWLTAHAPSRQNLPGYRSRDFQQIIGVLYPNPEQFTRSLMQKLLNHPAVVDTAARLKQIEPVVSKVLDDVNKTKFPVGRELVNGEDMKLTDPATEFADDAIHKAFPPKSPLENINVLERPEKNDSKIEAMTDAYQMMANLFADAEAVEIQFASPGSKPPDRMQIEIPIKDLLTVSETVFLKAAGLDFYAAKISTALEGVYYERQGKEYFARFQFLGEGGIRQHLHQQLVGWFPIISPAKIYEQLESYFPKPDGLKLADNKN